MQRPVFFTDASIVSMSSGTQRAQVDDLGVDARFRDHRLRDMDHRAVGEDRQRLALADDRAPCRAAMR